MIELGSYWAFYSMWFLKDANNGKVFLVDPSPKNLMHGMKNFSLNNLNGDFTCAFIAEKSYSKMNQIPTISLDSFANEKDIQDISVLHVDIQGYELEMMKGAQKLFQDKKIQYIFLATHSKKLHFECLEFLEKINYNIITLSDKPKNKWEDGFIFGTR